MAVAAFVYSLYGIYNEDLKILRVYPQLYCMDLVLNTIFTIIFGYSWYLVIDHTPKEEELSSEYANWQKQASPNALPAWKAESNVAILCLLVVWIIHVYFAVVIQSYADYMDKKYSLSTSNNNNNSRRSISGDALLSSPSNIDNSYRLTSVNALALSPSSTLNNDNSGSLRSNGRGGNISSRRVTIQDLEEGEDENYENNKNVF
ncbi:2490_t:CDS:2 [Ambispora leptoticha]|uniref:2490_t:CDS:1 n=1 Tax=Ambispora leptoticha TaxID=144679 RepID=A0A9N9G4C6_9GLOM|nr:2490_t:CDS:2 [Ambispora leptoticha]